MPVQSSVSFSSKPKRKPKKEKKTVGGFLSNFASGAGDALAMLLMSPYYLGKAGYSDARDAVNGGGFSSELGSLAKGVVTGLNDYYIKPFSQHGIHGFDEFWDNVYDNPAQIAIDAATIATGGGAAAGKLGSAVGKRAKAGSKAQSAGLRVAGLEQVGRAFKDLAPNEARGAIKLSDGSAAVPRRIKVRTSTDATPYSFAAPRNPVVRARKQLLERAYEKWGGENTLIGRATKSHFHPDVRAARLGKLDDERMLRRQAYAQAGRAAELAGRLSDAERKALFYRVPGFRDAERLGKLVAFRQATLQSVLERSGGKRIRDAAHLEDDIRTLTDPEVARAITDPSPAVLEAEQAFMQVSDMNQALRAARGKGDETIARARAPLESVPGIVIDPNEPLGIISYSTKRELGGRKTKGTTAKRQGTLSKELRTGMDIESTGEAWRLALYKPDPRKILEQYAIEMNHVGSLANWQRLLSAAVRYDPAAHSEAVASGKLKLVTPTSRLGKDIIEMVDFVTERLLPTAEKIGDMEVIRAAAILDGWGDEIDAGHALVVPAAYEAALARDAAASVGLIRQILTKPTKVWRDFALALKGSFYFNNVIGNLILGLVAYGPRYIPEIIFGGHIRSKKGLAARVNEKLPDIKRGNTNVLREWMQEEPAFGRLNPLRLVSQTADNIAEVMARFTEANFRKAAAAIEFKSEAAKYAKEAGISRAQALEAILNDAKAVDDIAEKVYGDMLDYSKLTPFERDYLRTVYPFWNFMREITRRTTQLSMDEPWKIAVMREMSKMSSEEQKDVIFQGLRKIPPHLRGLMPIGEPNKDGGVPVLSTYAANPFSGAADNLAQVGSIFSGDLAETSANPLAQMNPFVKSGLEALTGRDMFFDQPLQGSRSQIFVNQSLRQFPLYSMYERTRFPNPNAIVDRTGRQMLGQYMGVPTGTYNPSAALRSQAISDYYANKEMQRRARYEATRRNRDIGWDLGAVQGVKGMVSG